jgi:nucleoside-diphosphate-sugar epimerase
MYPLLKDKAIDWAIHAAYILPPIHDKGLMEDININGTKNFLSSCLKAGIPQLSSALPPRPTGSIRTMTCR